MGNSFGSPISQEDMDKLNERITEITGIFGNEMALATPLAVMEVIKEEKAGDAARAGMKLLAAEDADFVLHSGTVEKEGDPNALITSWRERFLVALNAADNYKIEYYDHEGGKKKGEYNCCGYRCRSFNSTEKDAYKHDHGITLEPYSSDRREYHIKCSDEQSEAEWKSVFTNSCRNAEPARHSNDVVAATFKIAFASTCSKAGIRTPGLYAGEAESLGSMLFDVLWDESLSALLDAIPQDTMMREKVVSASEALVRSSIMTACSVAWAAASEVAAGAADGIKAAAGAVADPFLEAENKLTIAMGKIAEKAIGKPIQTLLKNKSGGLIKILASIVCEAVPATIRGFDAELESYLREGKLTGADEDTMNAISIELAKATAYQNKGPLKESWRAAYRIIPEAGSDTFLEEADSLRTYDLYCMIGDAVKSMYLDMITTFFAKLKAGGGVAECIAKTTGEAAHDMPIVILKTITNIVVAVITGSPMWKEITGESLASLNESGAESLGALPEEVRSFFVVEDTTEKAVMKVLEGSLKPMIDMYTKKEKASNKDALVKELKADKNSAK
jgi:hypothetical protein